MSDDQVINSTSDSFSSSLPIFMSSTVTVQSTNMSTQITIKLDGSSYSVLSEVVEIYITRRGKLAYLTEKLQNQLKLMRGFTIDLYPCICARILF